MATLESIAAQTVAAIGSEIGYPIVAEWVRSRYQQLATRVKLKHLRQLGQVNIPPAITGTGATATRDSATIFLTAAPGSTSNAGSALVGRFIRLAVVWYEILDYRFDVAGNHIITIKTPFAESTVTAGAYTIVSRYVPVDPRAAYLGTSWVHARRRRPLARTTMDKLNLMAPYRPLVGSAGPQWVAEGPEIGGVKTIEVYPYPSLSEALFYVYWQDVPEISLTEELSSRIKAYALKEGALIDCYRYKMAQAIEKQLYESAGFYRNEMRAQETKWEDYLGELIQSDQGEEDGQFILKMLGGSSNLSEIRTARDHVWSTR